MPDDIQQALVDTLAQKHREFLAFLEQRLGDPQRAEEVLQAATLKGLEKSDSIRHRESVAAWFYRLLRNAIVDEYRRQDAERRALEGAAREAAIQAELGPELEGQVCRCVDGLIPTLRDDYRKILQAVDLEGQTPAAFARAEGLSRGSARVRLHRARRALRQRLEACCGTCAEHGCLDCSCGQPAAM